MATTFSVAESRCPYPEGNIGTKATFLFHHADIAWIHWLGMSNEEDGALTDKLKDCRGE